MTINLCTTEFSVTLKIFQAIFHGCGSQHTHRGGDGAPSLRPGQLTASPLTQTPFQNRIRYAQKAGIHFLHSRFKGIAEVADFGHWTRQNSSNIL